MRAPLGLGHRLLGLLGWTPRNRRQRRAAERRRSLIRRSRFDTLEQRVVLNADPIATDDEYNVLYGGELLISKSFILANDEDPDFDSLTITSFDATTSEGVSVSFDPYTEEFLYEAPSSFLGYDSFNYTVDDGNGGTDTGTVTFHVRNPFIEISDVIPNLSEINEGDSISLDVYYDSFGIVGTVLATVDWGDGTTSDDVPIYLGLSHRYIDDPSGSIDDYSISVTLVDSGNGSATDTDGTVVTVHNVAPDAGGLWGTFDENGDIVISHHGIIDPGENDVVSYDWLTSSGHSYASSLVYPTTDLMSGPYFEITVTDDDGGYSNFTIGGNLAAYATSDFYSTMGTVVDGVNGFVSQVTDNFLRNDIWINSIEISPGGSIFSDSTIDSNYSKFVYIVEDENAIHGSFSYSSSGKFTYVAADDGYDGPNYFNYSLYSTYDDSYLGSASVVFTVTPVVSVTSEGKSDDECSCSCGCQAGAADADEETGAINIKLPAAVNSWLNYNSSGQADTVIRAVTSIDDELTSTFGLELTFDGVTQDPVYYEKGAFAANAIAQLPLIAATSGMASGLYEWSARFFDPSNDDTLRTVGGLQTVVNTTQDGLSAGWSISGVDRLYVVGDEAALIKTDGTWSRYHGDGDGNYSAVDGFGDLTENGGGYRITADDGSYADYDSSGLLTARVDINGNTKTYTYSGNLLSEIEDAIGRVTTFNYTSTTLTSITDPDGRVTTLGYTSMLLTSITQPDPDDGGPLAAPVTQFTYSDGRLATQTDAEAGVRTYFYDYTGRISSLTDPDGLTKSLVAAELFGLPTGGSGTELDPASLTPFSDRQGQTTDAQGHVTTFTLDLFGQRTAETDSLGRVTLYERDRAGHVVTRTEVDQGPGGFDMVTTYEYDGDNQTRTVYDDGHSEEWDYATDTDRVSEYRLKDNLDTVIARTLYEYDGAGNRTKETRVIGAVDEEVDSDVDPNNDECNDHVVTYEYLTAANGLPEGLLETMTEWSEDSADDVVTTYSYYDTTNNSSHTALIGLVKSVTRGTSGLSSTTNYAYDEFGNLTRETQIVSDDDEAYGITENDDRITLYAYDALDRVTKMTRVVGEGIDDELNGDMDGGNDEHDDAVTLYQYDAVGRVISETQLIGEADDPTGANDDGTDIVDDSLTLTEYDSAGRVIKTTQVVGHIDAIVNIDMDGGNDEDDDVVHSYGYDDGDLVSETDALGRTTTYDYVDHQLLRRTDPDPDDGGDLPAPITEYRYDDVGRLTKVIQVIGELDDEINLETDDIVNETVYDAAGRVNYTIDALGRTTTYTYDSLGRTTVIAGPLSTVSYVYDARGNVVDQFTTNDLSAPAHLHFEYDALDRQTFSVQVRGDLDAEAYDPETDPDDVVTGTEYDRLGRVSAQIDPLGRRTEYRYDGLGNAAYIVTIVDPEETDFDSPVLNLVTRYEYNNAGDLVKITVPDPDGAGDGLSPVTDLYYDRLGRQTITRQVVGATADTLGSTTDDVVNETVYDNLGRVVSAIDPRGGATVFAYDALGRRISVTQPDPDGVESQTSPVTMTTYNKLGQVTEVLDVRGFRTLYEYDALNRLVAVSLPHDPEALTWDNTLERTYDDAGRVWKEFDALGRLTTYTYDKAGRLVQAVYDDVSDVTMTYSYDVGDRPQEVIDPVHGSMQQLHYDVYRMVEDYVYWGSAWTLIRTTTYDDLGRVLSVANVGSDTTAASTTTYEYALDGQLLSETVVDDEETVLRRTDYVYDEHTGWRTHVVQVSGARDDVVNNDEDEFNDESDDLDSETVYDNLGRVVSQLDPLDHSTQYGYDRLGRVVLQTDAEDGETSFHYDQASNRTDLTDPEGNTTYWAYDSLNRVTAEYRSALFGPHYRTYVYDAAGNLIRRNGYDDGVLLTETVTQQGSVEAKAQITITASGSYDATYDNFGNYVANDGDGNYAISSGGTGWNILSISGNSVTFEAYNPGPVTSASKTSGDGSVSLTDGSYYQSEIHTITPSPNVPTGGTYWLAGQLLNFDDDASTIATALSASFGSGTPTISQGLNSGVITVTSAAAENVSDTALSPSGGNLTFGGSVVDYVYDAQGRRIQELWFEPADAPTDPVATGGSIYDAANSFTYEYDAAGRLSAGSAWWNWPSENPGEYDYTNAMSANEYEYDRFDRVIATTSHLYGQDNVVLNQNYDASGNRESLAVEIDSNADFASSYEYDAYDQLARLAQAQETGVSGQNAVGAKWAEFAYNGLGQFASLSRGTSTDPVVATTYEYDAFARLAALTHRLGDGESSAGDPDDIVAGYTYAYDAAGRITGFTNTQHSAETSTNSYDQTNQLTDSDRTGSGNDESYDYDANGNRDSVDYTTDWHNRTVEDADFTYAYNAEGNRVAKTRKSGTTDDHFVEYQWDYRNRLTAVVFKNNGGSVTKRVEYQYDVFDHMIVRLVDTTSGDGFVMTDAAAARYVYDGDQIVLAFAGTNGSAWDLEQRYVWGPQIDQLLAQEEFDATNNDIDAIYWQLTDHQNTVRDLVNAGGDLVAHFAYDSFGNLISAVDGSNAAITDVGAVTHFLYTARWFDFDTGLQNNWHRWYDPQLGKWISEDPIQDRSGQFNYNSYVGNSPFDRTDATGLASKGELDELKKDFNSKYNKLTVIMDGREVPPPPFQFFPYLSADNLGETLIEMVLDSNGDKRHGVYEVLPKIAGRDCTIFLNNLYYRPQMNIAETYKGVSLHKDSILTTLNHEGTHAWSYHTVTREFQKDFSTIKKALDERLALMDANNPNTSKVKLSYSKQIATFTTQQFIDLYDDRIFFEEVRQMLHLDQLKQHVASIGPDGRRRTSGVNTYEDELIAYVGDPSLLPSIVTRDLKSFHIPWPTKLGAEGAKELQASMSKKVDQLNVNRQNALNSVLNRISELPVK